MLGRRKKQKGEGWLGCIVWALIILTIGLIAYRTIPVKIRSAQFYDSMVEQAKFADRNPPTRIRQSLLRKAKELDMPLDPKNLKVERYGDNIRMKAQYTITVELPFYSWDWEFRPEVDRPIFIL